ncbi:MAG: arylesterase [Nitrospirae bacterium]|nr:arylesterase [Candidatus Manganitrophaceae bacterium]
MIPKRINPNKKNGLKRAVVVCLLFLSFCTESADAEKKQVIVAFGDSLTAGFGVSADQAYPAQLAKKLSINGHPSKVVNAGVSGETTAGGLRRIRWIFKNQPDIVILCLGANDGLRGLSLLEMEKNLSKIITALQKEKVKVILAGMKIPPNYGIRYTRAFEAVYPRLAKRFELPLIPFLLEGVATHPTLNQADGIHPTAEGYKIIVDHMWPIVQKVLKTD